jgi:hypothetical protein
MKTLPPDENLRLCLLLTQLITAKEVTERTLTGSIRYHLVDTFANEIRATALKLGLDL